MDRSGDPVLGEETGRAGDQVQRNAVTVVAATARQPMDRWEGLQAKQSFERCIHSPAQDIQSSIGEM